MSWINDPNAWIGLATLIGLEIVLGIDNLVFTAILADRLPPSQRRQARLIGLTLALLMRLGLLATLSILAKLTTPLVSAFGFAFSGRDLILLAGGIFLLAKGVTELNERIEAGMHGTGARRKGPAFWQVIVQIILLDLVFSLDSIITAIGMVEHLSVMVIAVIVAMAVMILASGPLTAFVNRRPTVVILCLGFLLLIGFSLITEGFGLHIPKAYLYAAIVFSVLVEAANELRRRNVDRRSATASRRERASEIILRLLAGRDEGEPQQTETAPAGTGPAAANDERAMLHGVLELSERRLRSLMTPRGDVQWLDVAKPPEAMREAVEKLTHTHVLLALDRVDNVVGVARTRDLLAAPADAPFDPVRLSRPPLVLPDTLGALRAVSLLRAEASRFAVVADEHGSVQGVVTPFDILEAIAGDFPDADEAGSAPTQVSENEWLVDGGQDVRRLGAAIGHDLADATDRYTTVAGLILAKLERLPNAGDRVSHGDLELQVIDLDGRNAGQVRIAARDLV